MLSPLLRYFCTCCFLLFLRSSFQLLGFYIVVHVHETCYKEFIETSRKLEGLLSLGSLVQVAIYKRSSCVFVKKSPEQVAHILQTIIHGLCALKEYRKRFAMRMPTLIAVRTRAQLVTLGLVSAKQLK